MNYISEFDLGAMREREEKAILIASISIVNPPDANEEMRRRDREGAPWVPLATSPAPESKGADWGVLDRAVRLTLARASNTCWTPERM